MRTVQYLTTFGYINLSYRIKDSFLCTLEIVKNNILTTFKFDNHIQDVYKLLLKLYAVCNTLSINALRNT